jgi:DNA-binding transcriptional ArsR family regulator
MYAKLEEFEVELQEMAKTAKVLSHPARLAIIKYLAEQKTCISGDISNEIPLSRTTVSQHLQELKEAGLIKGTIDGLKVNYCICNSKLKKVKEMFERYFAETVTDNDNC